MAEIIQFPFNSPEQHELHAQIDNLFERAESLLKDYSAEQIILALFQKAVEPEDVAALMPSFSIIVDKQDN